MLQETQTRRKSGAYYRKQRKVREAAAEAARIQLMKEAGIELAKPEGLPDWSPREHQKLVLDAYERGIRRQAHVWHRRAGKSAVCLNLLVRAALDRPGNYWYLTPKSSQTRTIMWESRRHDGIREIDIHIPRNIRDRVNENLMQIDLLNGSSIKFQGSDNFDKLVGANVHGIIFDEFARADPAAWDYLSPILVADPDKKAWAVFISTYLGKNHWYRLVQRVKEDPEWVVSFKSITDTVREDGITPIVSLDDIERERAQGKAEEYIQQEYFNNATAGFEGAYYGTAMRLMQDERRIGPVTYDPAIPVMAAVDLGFADELVFTFWQSTYNEERCIGSVSYKFTNLPDALDDIKLRFPWGKRPMTAILPHDGRFGTAELFAQYGYDPLVLPQSRSVVQDIEKVRQFLGRVRIDNDVRAFTKNQQNNDRLIEALSSYRTERSRTDSEAWQKNPKHDWTSHWADSVRYYTVYRDRSSPGDVGYGKLPQIDYSQHDRCVIGGTIK